MTKGRGMWAISRGEFDDPAPSRRVRDVHATCQHPQLKLTLNPPDIFYQAIHRR